MFPISAAGWSIPVNKTYFWFPGIASQLCLNYTYVNVLDRKRAENDFVSVAHDAELRIGHICTEGNVFLHIALAVIGQKGGHVLPGYIAEQLWRNKLRSTVRRMSVL